MARYYTKVNYIIEKIWNQKKIIESSPLVFIFPLEVSPNYKL